MTEETLAATTKPQKPHAKNPDSFGVERPPTDVSKAPQKRSRLIPVTKWNDHHQWPPIGGLRHLIFYEQTNGFSECVVRVGRRVLIDEDKFFRWVEKRNGMQTH